MSDVVIVLAEQLNEQLVIRRNDCSMQPLDPRDDDHDAGVQERSPWQVAFHI
jgi:hypothetical protein